MICIVKIQTVDSLGPFGGTLPTPEITGWMIANDVSELRHRAQASGDTALVAELYEMEFSPRAGKYKLKSGHILLVD